MYRAPPRPCPSCRATLPDGDVAECGACHGVWASEAEVARRIADAEVGDGTLTFVAHPQLARSRPCPACGEPMLVGLARGVVVDRCARGDGLWFDPLELARVLGDEVTAPLELAARIARIAPHLATRITADHTRTALPPRRRWLGVAGALGAAGSVLAAAAGPVGWLLAGGAAAGTAAIVATRPRADPDALVETVRLLLYRPRAIRQMTRGRDRVVVDRVDGEPLVIRIGASFVDRFYDELCALAAARGLA